MSSIDDRVVAMKFDNAQFESGASTTLSTLDRLKQALNFTGASKGLETVGSAAGASVGGVESLGSSVNGVSNGFLAMATVALTALSNITNRAVDTGLSIAKSLAFEPIQGGFQDYETNLKAIRTIAANTDAPLKQINTVLNEMNKYADQTIYNFAEMAKNVGTFTAAGVGLKDSVASIKGIANLAALSGSTSLQASTAMYQLSQAIAASRVSLQDWNSVVNAGMGGKKLQNSLAQTAVAMGEIASKSVDATKAVKINGESFRDSIGGPGPKWLTSDVLVNTLKTLDGRFSATKYAVEGLDAAETKAAIAQARLNLEQKDGVKYTDAQFKAVLKTAEAAYTSATQVSTFGGALDQVKETIRSGWQNSFAIIFGDVKQATTLWTGAASVLNKFANASAASRNGVLRDWSEMNGRFYIIDGFKKGFEALISVLTPIKEAFRSIFPATTAQDLINLSLAFWNFMGSLKIGKATAEDIKRTFAGLFAVLDIGWQIVKGVAGVIGYLISTIAGGSGGILNFTGNIGDFLVSIDEAIKKGDLLKKFFQTLGVVLSLPIKLIQAMADKLGSMFDGVDIGAGIEKVVSFFTNAGQAIADAFNLDNITAGASILSAGGLAGIFLVLKQFYGKLTTIFNGGLFGGGGLVDTIKDTFGALTNTLNTMQNTLNATTLLLLAGAIALLAASVLTLSFIDGKALLKSMIALGFGMKLLMSGLGMMLRLLDDAGGVAKIFALSFALIAISSAMLLMSFAIRNLSGLSWEELAKGLLGVFGVLKAISLGMQKMPKDIFKQAAAILLLSIALNALYLAVKNFGSLDLVTMGKGLLGISGSLLAIGFAMKRMPKDMFKQAAGILLISIALNGIALAMKQLGELSLEELGKGIGAIALSLGLIALAMNKMPKDMIKQAFALDLVAAALVGIGVAIALMGGMSLESLGKGIGAMALALGILAVVLNKMDTTIAGAAALAIAAGAINILVPALALLGSLSIKTLIKGLVGLGIALAILTVAGAALADSGAVLGLLGLGAAVFLVGAGMALAGAGFLAFATGLTAILGVGAVGVAMLTNLLGALIQAIPLALQAFAQGIVLFTQVLVENIPVFQGAFVAMVTAMLTSLTTLMPLFATTFLTFLKTILVVLTTATPWIIEAGFKLLMSFLQGIRDHIGEIVTVVGEIIVNFLNALSEELPQITQAGIDFIVDFMNNLATAIDENQEEVTTAAENLGVSIIMGIIHGVGQVAKDLWDAVTGAVSDALEGAHDEIDNPPFPSGEGIKIGRSIIVGMTRGVSQSADGLTRETKRVTAEALDTMKKSLSDISTIVAKDVDAKPTITPVLDLTNVQKNASQIGSLLDQNAVNAQVSLSQADAISIAAQTAKDDSENRPDQTAKEISFVQNNTSPKALTPIEIYRNTRSQLALAKEALEAS